MRTQRPMEKSEIGMGWMVDIRCSAVFTADHYTGVDGFARYPLDALVVVEEYRCSHLYLYRYDLCIWRLEVLFASDTPNQWL